MHYPAIAAFQRFKWVITAFLDDFFKLCFPSLTVRRFRLLDKEFYNRLGAQDQSTEADLLILAEVLIDGKAWQLMILIELKSRKVRAMAQIRNYLLHACLIWKRPIWPLLLYTDGRTWKTKADSSFPLAFHSVHGLNHVHCDIIRLKDFNSAELSESASLLAKLFALKASGGERNREQKVRGIYQTLKARSTTLKDDQKLAAERFVTTYGTLPPDRIEAIKQEVDMKFMGNTITEYYTILGEERGIKLGEERGEARGMLRTLKQLLAEGMIDQPYYDKASAPLYETLAKLEKQQSPV